MSDLTLFHRFVGDKSVQAITTRTIDDFVQWQSEQGLRASTINRRLSTISSLFKFLIGEAGDDIWRNPVRWKRHSIRPGRRLPRDVSDETVAQLFTVIDDCRDRAIFTLMVGAGLRVGEVVSLQLGDVQDTGAFTLDSTAGAWQGRQRAHRLANRRCYASFSRLARRTPTS